MTPLAGLDRAGANQRVRRVFEGRSGGVDNSGRVDTKKFLDLKTVEMQIASEYVVYAYDGMQLECANANED